MALLLSAAAGSPTTEELLGRLGDERYKVRIQAASALASQGDPRARAAIEGLLNDKEALVRAAACDALMALGDPSSIAAIKRVSRDRDDAVRRRARLAIRVLKGVGRARGKRAEVGSVVINEPMDRSSGDFTGVLDALRRGLVDEKSKQSIALQALKRRYMLMTNVRSVKKRASATETTVETECDMTVAELPQRTLRLSTKVTAGAAIGGKPSPAIVNELAHDAAYGAGVELFKEFASWAVIQPPPGKKSHRKRKRRR